jgi:hypothetical protein
MPILPDVPQTEIAIVALTNAFRQENRLGSVVPNGELNAAAKGFAEYLAKTGKFAHEADGREPQQRAEAQGYRYCMVAENLASNLDSRGYTSESLAGQVVEGWKASPPHRRNLLEPAITEIGVAVVQAPSLDPKFLSVQMFGRPLSLQVRFTIRNETTDLVSYTLAEETHAIEPRTIVAHEFCMPGGITFDRAGNWLTGTSIGLRFEPREGTLFTLRRSGSAIKVDVDAGARR